MKTTTGFGGLMPQILKYLIYKKKTYTIDQPLIAYNTQIEQPRNNKKTKQNHNQSIQ